jgi:hypothetical protein
MQPGAPALRALALGSSMPRFQRWDAFAPMPYGLILSLDEFNRKEQILVIRGVFFCVHLP